MPRALSIYLPRWPVYLAMRRHLRNRCEGSAVRNANVKRMCVLLIAAARGKQFIRDCCANAFRCGVRRGITLAHARALVGRHPTIEAEHQPDEDDKTLLRLARWALRYGPTVAPDPPDGLFMDITGCAALFGSEADHVAAIDTALRRLGLTPQIAVAPTYGCAWAMARHGKRRVVSVADHQIRECLTELPVEALRIDESIRAALADVDIRCVGELFDLPHDDLAARYGHELLGRIHQALGDAYETIEPIRPADPLTVIRAFDGPIRHAGIIEGTVRDLLESLIDLLTRRGKGAYELLLTLWRVDAGPMREAFRFTQATREFKHIWSMVENRLHALRIGHGVEEITLDATRTDDLHGEQTAMWGRDDDGAANVVALGRLVDCLMERLGGDAVTAIAPVESHIPERAYERVAPLAKATAPVVLSRGVQRPSLLLDRPEPVRVIALFPNGPPAWMQWRGDGLDIDAADGPERIALPWWNRKAGAARDYYTVRDARGRCLWIFRAREGQADGQWFVHGIWA